MQHHFQVFLETFHTWPLFFQINFTLYAISILITTYILLFYLIGIQDNINACKKTKGGRYIGIPLLILVVPISCFSFSIFIAPSLMFAIGSYYLFSALHFLWSHGLEKTLYKFFTWYNSPIKKENGTNA